MCRSPVEYKWTAVYEKQETKGWHSGRYLKKKTYTVPSVSQSDIVDTRSCRGLAGHAQWNVMHSVSESLCLEAPSQEPLVPVTNSLDALRCPLIQGTLHSQQVFVHFDKCQLLNTRFGERRVTETILPLSHWWPFFHSACWGPSGEHTLGPDSLS